MNDLVHKANRTLGALGWTIRPAWASRQYRYVLERLATNEAVEAGDRSAHLA